MRLSLSISFGIFWKVFDTSWRVDSKSGGRSGKGGKLLMSDKSIDSIPSHGFGVRSPHLPLILSKELLISVKSSVT